MIQTPSEQKVEERIRAEIDLITEELKKLQARIDRTQVKSPLFKELCKAKGSLDSQRNAKINLLNTVK